MNQSIGQTQYWTRGNTVPPPPPPPLVTPLLQFSLSLNIIPDLLFLTCPLGATVESAAPVCHPTESSDISTTATHQLVVHSLYYWTPTSMLFEQFTSHFLSTLSPDIKWVILTVWFLILRLTTRPCFWVESLNSTVSVHTTKRCLIVAGLHEVVAHRDSPVLNTSLVQLMFILHVHSRRARCCQTG